MSSFPVVRIKLFTWEINNQLILCCPCHQETHKTPMIFGIVNQHFLYCEQFILSCILHTYFNIFRWSILQGCDNIVLQMQDNIFSWLILWDSDNIASQLQGIILSVSNLLSCQNYILDSLSHMICTMKAINISVVCPVTPICPRLWFSCDLFSFLVWVLCPFLVMIPLCCCRPPAVAAVCLHVHWYLMPLLSTVVYGHGNETIIVSSTFYICYME
jgi:hypothetical protein